MTMSTKLLCHQLWTSTASCMSAPPLYDQQFTTGGSIFPSSPVVLTATVHPLPDPPDSTLALLLGHGPSHHLLPPLRATIELISDWPHSHQFLTFLLARSLRRISPPSPLSTIELSALGIKLPLHRRSLLLCISIVFPYARVAGDLLKTPEKKQPREFAKRQFLTPQSQFGLGPTYQFSGLENGPGSSDYGPD